MVFGIGRKGVRDDEGLVLGRAPHVVVGVVGELEDMRGKGGLVFRRVPIVCGILLEDRVGVGCDVLVWVDCDEGGGSDAGVNCVGHETLAETGDDDIVRDGG